MATAATPTSPFKRALLRAILVCSVFLVLPPNGSAEQFSGKDDPSRVAKEEIVVSKGNPHDTEGRPLVALTFDDGPHPELTPQLLDILKSTQSTATFYVVGRAAAAHPEILNRIFLEGHEIGNHTWSHSDMRKLTKERLLSETGKTTDAIMQVTGEHPYGIRPPYGACNDKVLSLLPPQLRPVVMWTVDPLDWKRPGSQEVARRVLEKVTPGAIVLLHDIHPGTIQAVPSIIEGLRNKGYRMVTVSEILAQATSISLDDGENEGGLKNSN
jgi:peptidoglycan/xylan/chitin deacetylase (PgdA/CDA1 family)